MVGTLLERLRVPCATADSKTAADKIELLRSRLVEAYEENLYASLHDGVTGNEGKWWPGGLSTAEWFCRQAGIGVSPEFTKDELLARVPDIAQEMVNRILES